MAELEALGMPGLSGFYSLMSDEKLVRDPPPQNELESAKSGLAVKCKHSALET